MSMLSMLSTRISDRLVSMDHESIVGRDPDVTFMRPRRGLAALPLPGDLMKTRERIAWVIAGVLALASLANAAGPVLAQQVAQSQEARPVESVPVFMNGGTLWISGYQVDSATICYTFTGGTGLPLFRDGAEPPLSCVTKVPAPTQA